MSLVPPSVLLWVKLCPPQFTLYRAWEVLSPGPHNGACFGHSVFADALGEEEATRAKGAHHVMCLVSFREGSLDTERGVHRGRQWEETLRRWHLQERGLEWVFHPELH